MQEYSISNLIVLVSRCPRVEYLVGVDVQCTQSPSSCAWTKTEPKRHQWLTLYFTTSFGAVQ